MKILLLKAFLTTFTSHATIWTCTEIPKSSNQKDSLTSVVVTEISDITKEISADDITVDLASIVKVEIFARSIKTNTSKLIKAFQSIALTREVQYEIKSDTGVNFWMYLDEMDQSGMTIQNGPGGLATQIDLSCESDSEED